MDFQLLAIGFFFIAFFTMKALALMGSANADWSFLYRSPVFAPFSERRSLRKNQSSVKRLKERFLFIATANILAVEFYQFLFSAFTFGNLVKAWLFAPYIYLFTNLLGISSQCIGLLTKEMPTDIHNLPYLSKNISEFWGKRWNVWVSDWLAVMSKRLTRKPGTSRIFAAFLISGIFHEFIVALPYYVYSGKNYFGYMTLFFVLQFFFVAFDKKYLAKKSQILRTWFMWLSILAPMPLFINPSVLAFFGF